MKRIMITFILLMIMVINSYGSDITVTLIDGIDNAALRTKMEKRIERILNEINAAQAAGRDLDFSVMGSGASLQRSLEMLWQNTPFLCTDDEIVEHCITTGSGYQVRNIPLMMKPTEDRAFNEEEYQEAVISFDKQGNVESFYLSISMNLYMNVIKSNLELTDLRHRQIILDYVERFRTAYNQRDLNFLEQVFSDNALIIRGKVIRQKHNEVYSSEKIEYYRHTKQEYLAKIKRIFRNARYFKITFNEIEVMRHPTNPNYYGVTLLQGYTHNNYHDDGYLFLLWDFTNEDQPQIHVRTWQPSFFNGHKLPKEDVFTLDDFDIY